MSGKVGVNAMLYPLFSFYINIGKVKKGRTEALPFYSVNLNY
jgi:hypothetical protein